MAHLWRHLIRCAATIFIVAGHIPASRAQSDSPPPPQPLYFRVLSLGNAIPLADLRYEYKGKLGFIAPSDVALSPLYPREKSGPVTFYREVPPVPPETKPQRIPVFTADLGESGLQLLILKGNRDNTISHVVINDSWESFPAQTVRVLSFSRRKIAAEVETRNAEITPGQSNLFSYSSDRPRIRCKVASLNEGTWKLNYNKSQAVVPGARINIIISDDDPTPADPVPESISVSKMIDPLPAPKAGG
jgi:hypothetical protein